MFAVAQYVMRAGLLLRGIIAARLLGPGAYGAWNALMLIMDYGAQSNMGTFQGLDQLTPREIVRGDARSLLRLKRAGMFTAMLLPGLFGLGCLLYFSNSAGKIVTAWGVGGVAVAIAIVLLVSFSFVHLSLLRAHDRISEVSLWFIVQGVVGVALGLALIPTLGVWGLLIGWLVGTLASTLNLRRRAGDLVPLMPAPSVDVFRILRTGFPMFVHTGSSFVTRTLDRVIILRYIGTLELGYYSLSVTALTLLMYLPDSVAYVLYPQLLRSYHAAGDQPDSIWPRVSRALQAVSVFVPALSGVGYLMAADLVHVLLPQFLSGVPAMRIVSYGAGGLAIASLSAIVLMTLGRRRYLMVTSVCVTLLTAALDYAVVRAGYGITGVAMATISMYLLSGMLLLGFALGGFPMSGGALFWRLVRAFAPLGASFAIVYGIEHVFPWMEEAMFGYAMGRLSLAIVVFLALYVLVTRPLSRGIGIRQTLAEFNVPGFRRVQNGDRIE